MNKSWPSGNSYLRLLSSLPLEPNKVMTLSMLQVSELQLVLEAILTLEEHMKSGKARLRCLTTINLTVVDSEEIT